MRFIFTSWPLPHIKHLQCHEHKSWGSLWLICKNKLDVFSSVMWYDVIWCILRGKKKFKDMLSLSFFSWNNPFTFLCFPWWYHISADKNHTASVFSVQSCLWSPRVLAPVEHPVALRRSAYFTWTSRLFQKGVKNERGKEMSVSMSWEQHIL